MKNDRPIRPRRSFIFSPGIKPELFPKALACGADIVCVELEDGIAPKDKDAARRHALALFAKDISTDPFNNVSHDKNNDGIERILRINCLRNAFGLADISAVLAMDTPPPALMLPKVMTPDEVVWLDDLLTEHNHPTRLHIIIETNQGLEAAHEIAAASTRIDALLFGGIDMAAELRCKNTWEALLYARSRVVHAAATAGIDAIDVPWLDLHNITGMTVEATRARDLGFCGKGAIHPKQIPAINTIFTPTPTEITHAQNILKAFEKADSGLVVIDGKLIEKPVLRTMQRVIAIAERSK